MTDRYAVIGNPIAHSKSPQIHKMFAEQTGQDISYEKIEAPLDDFAAKIEELRKAGYKGCNVTVPFKFEAYKLASKFHEYVYSEQAANTLKFNGDIVIGENTDGTGLVRDIQSNLGISLNNRRVLLIGAGGAADGVVLPLRDAGAQLTIVNRTVDKARELAARKAPDSISACGYDELAGKQFDVVINATSAGLSDSELPLPPTIFASGALAYDMMYGRETPFMKFAREHGAAVVADGLGMLVEQAAESFFIWRAVRPDTAPVIAALRKQQ
jgi:shikimate dehydrogenase